MLKFQARTQQKLSRSYFLKAIKIMMENVERGPNEVQDSPTE